MALAAIADNGDLLALDQINIGVPIVIKVSRADEELAADAAKWQPLIRAAGIEPS
jgi:hypothetical protein